MKLFTFIKDGFKGVFRNGLMSFASIFVLLSSLLMIGIFTTVIYNVNANLEDMEQFKTLVCYLYDDVDVGTDENPTELQNEIIEEIKALDNVESVRFISEATALDREQAKYGDDKDAMMIFEMYENESRENPLPNAFEIDYYSVEKLTALEANLEVLGKTETETGYIESIRNSSEIAQNIENLKNVITVGGSWLMILLIVVSVFVISNTIKITYHSRELEIGIMRYIGATKFYITMPFIIESIIISLVSAVIGYVAQWYLYITIVEGVQEKYSIIKIVPYEELNNIFLLIYFGAALVIGVVGSVITIRKYMKV